MEKKKLSLPAQIFIALLLGIVVGLAFYFMGKPEITTNYLKPFGTIFVNLLKFIVVPVVLLSMIDGIVSQGRKGVRRMPGHREAMKDAANSEMRRRAVSTQ